MNTRIIDRLDRYISVRRLNDSKVTKDAGLSQGTICRARDNGCDLSDRAVLKILETYTDLNKDWLLNGVGRMIVTPNSIYDRLEGILRLEGIEISAIEDVNHSVIGTFQRELLNSNIDIARVWARTVCSYFEDKYSFNWILYGKNSPDEDVIQKIKVLEVKVEKLQEIIYQSF